MRLLITIALILIVAISNAQDSTKVYKKRVLESIEVDFLASYYSQEGDNAAVTGGIGMEKLTDVTPTIVVAIPLNDDDVLTIDAGISAYTSASSGNVNPFDGTGDANPFTATSGASNSDTWINGTFTYSHSSDDRNKVWSGKLSVSSEYDYFSVGVGASHAWLFNEKNTELNIHGNIYVDTWQTIYPIELRPFSTGGIGLNNSLFISHTVTGNANYNPTFHSHNSKGRNSYSIGFAASQILSKKLQGSFILDVVQQEGLLSSPMQRVYFSDVADSFIENFQLADDIEQLPGTRFKTATGTRLNYYINEVFVLRTYYRYYSDDWGITSNTASIELPIKIASKFTVYPSYRYYDQTAADHFATYEENLSTSEFYTSDYDLSEYTANQYAFGISYTDIFTSFKLGKFGLKNIDLKYTQYERDSGLKASLIAAGFKFVIE